MAEGTRQADQTGERRNLSRGGNQPSLVRPTALPLPSPFHDPLPPLSLVSPIFAPIEHRVHLAAPLLPQEARWQLEWSTRV